MLDRIHKIAEFIAAFAIVGSLVFVGIQLNQNTDALRVTVGESYVDKWLDAHRTVIGDDVLALAIIKQSANIDDYSELEWVKKSSFAHLTMRQSEYMHRQYLLGNLDEQFWQSWYEGTVNALKDPFFKVVLQQGSRRYSPDFIALTEEIYEVIEARKQTGQPTS